MLSVYYLTTVLRPSCVDSIQENVMAVVEIFYASLLRQDVLISSDNMSSDAVEKTAMV